MSFHPHTILELKMRSIQEKFNLAPGVVRGVMGEFVEGLHEISFKGTSTDCLLGVYFFLGDEAAWHFLGTLLSTLDGRDSDTLADLRRMLIETATRLDGRMSRYRCILDRWKEEKEYALEQDRLEKSDDQKKHQ